MNVGLRVQAGSGALGQGIRRLRFYWLAPQDPLLISEQNRDRPHAGEREPRVGGKTEEALQARVRALAAQVALDYKGRCVTHVGVLKGCVLFLSDLLKRMEIETNVDFMMVTSYSGVQSTGVVRTILDLKQNIEGRDVVIVEDIIDTGLTLSYLVKVLREREPASLRVCAFLDKKERRQVPFEADYVGFTIPDGFVVGYGLDFNENFRFLPDVCVLHNIA